MKDETQSMEENPMKRAISYIVLLLLLTYPGTFMAGEKVTINSPAFKEVFNMLSIDGHKDHEDTCSVKQQYTEEVLAMLNDGMEKEEIIDHYVSQLGEKALAVPPKSGFNLTAWIIPGTVIIASAGILFFILTRRKKNETQSLNGTNNLKPKTTALQELIEEERQKRF